MYQGYISGLQRVVYLGYTFKITESVLRIHIKDYRELYIWDTR